MVYYNGWKYLYKEYRDIDGERIRLERNFTGEFTITYQYGGWSEIHCGGFETEEEATAAIFKHRPNAKFYGACK